MAMVSGAGLSSKCWVNWVGNGKKTNDKHQISNKSQIQHHNDRNFVWDLVRRSLGGFGFLVIGYYVSFVICDLFFPVYPSQAFEMHSWN